MNDKNVLKMINFVNENMDKSDPFSLIMTYLKYEYEYNKEIVDAIEVTVQKSWYSKREAV